MSALLGGVIRVIYNQDYTYNCLYFSMCWLNCDYLDAGR